MESAWDIQSTRSDANKINSWRIVTSTRLGSGRRGRAGARSGPTWSSESDSRGRDPGNVPIPPQVVCESVGRYFITGTLIALASPSCRSRSPVRRPVSCCPLAAMLKARQSDSRDCEILRSVLISV